MRTAFLFLALILIIGSLATAQTLGDEYTILRDHLNIPAATPIKSGNASSTIFAAPLKVFIATGGDEHAHRNYIEWAEKWNAKDAGELGVLELVPEPSQAQIILVLCSVDFDPHSKVLRQSGQGQGFSKFYGYILEKKPDGLEVLKRYTETTMGNGFRAEGKTIWEDFRRLVTRQRQNKARK